VKQSRGNLFLVTRFKLQGQSDYSQIQYSKSLEKLTGPNTLILPETIMDKLHSVLTESTLFTKQLGRDEVYYFMHRKENPKFTNLQIREFIDEGYSSIELLDHLSIIPASYWTFTSSALLDIFFKYGAHSSLRFYFSEPIFSRRLPKFSINTNIDPDKNLLEIFRNSGFREIRGHIGN
jgi:hypothetical protein